MRKVGTAIECPSPKCPGCLVGEINEEKNLIEFSCNECKYHAGYIDLKHLKKQLNNK